MDAALKILIIEDDIITSWALEETLIETGYTVCSKATDYESAIRTMKRESPDLALVDIGLEGKIDGIATVREILRIKWLPIIYLTGNKENNIYERAKKTHPTAFLYKPFRRLDLCRQIDLAITNFYGNEVPLGSSLSKSLFVWIDKAYVRIEKNEIAYVKAVGSYSEIFLTIKEFKRIKSLSSSYAPILVSVGFGNLAAHLGGGFYTIGRSASINLKYLDRIESNQVVLGAHVISLPEGNHKRLMEQIYVLKSRKKDKDDFE